MSNLDNPIRVDGGQQQVKQCCATLYESDLARFLLGDSLHPGGMELTRQLGHMLGLNPASRLLDVASGNGTTAVYLAKEFGCTIVGVDYGYQNVQTARSLAQTEHLESRVGFEQSDAESLPFSDGSFDAVICECAFCTFPDKIAAAKEFFRVLRRGGQVGISDLTRKKVLPKELNGILAWISCIGDAQPIDGYATFLRRAGFSVGGIEERNDALEEMTNQIRLKLLGAEIMTGLNRLQVPGLDLGAAKRMANSALAAIKRGDLGYAFICAKKPV
jgi:arsenite methyltransferase